MKRYLPLLFLPLLAGCGEEPVPVHGVMPGMSAVDADNLLHDHFGPQHPMARIGVTGGFIYVNEAWPGVPKGMIVPESRVDPQGPITRMFNPCILSLRAAGYAPEGAECVSVGTSHDLKVTQIIRVLIVNGKAEALVSG